MNAEPSPTVLAPRDEDEAAAFVARAAAGHSFEIMGGGTRQGLGRPLATDATMSTENLRGVAFYEPAELVIGAKAGTPLREVEAALAEHGQMLAFEPMDHRGIYGIEGEPTVGGVVAVNASGPRRIKVGAARDAVLGVRFINGRGEIIKSGGRVMKNVTGLDLVKALCGSHGTLGFMTEVVFKVLPKPQSTVTVAIDGLTDHEAIAAMASALGSPFEPSGAAHLPAGGADDAETLIRLDGFDDSVAYRSGRLAEKLTAWGEARVIDGPESDRRWSQIRDATPVSEPRDQAIWRVSITPSVAPSVANAVAEQHQTARWFYDHGGALLWIAVEAIADAGATTIRGAIGADGHATLIRAPEAVRHSVPVFQPLTKPLADLAKGLKQSFDPSRLFQPGKMYADH